MAKTLRKWIFVALMATTATTVQAQSGKLDGAYLCGINGQCVYTPLIAQRYELVITTECGAWHDQLKADNPDVMTFIYTSGTDNYTNPYPVDEGWYYAGREHAWLKQRCRELGYSPEILYMHYYENTVVNGFTIPGTYSTTLTDADSVSRVPVYLGYYSGDGVGRMLVNFSHPITRQLQIEYAKKAWTDPDAGTDWPQTSYWDGYYMDNWVANELDPGMGQIGSVTSGGRLVEHPTHAVIYSSESINWYQQQQNQFARELRDVLHNGAEWSPDGKPKYLCANIANSWTADFADPEICGLDFLNMEFQYSPLRNSRYALTAAYSRDSACYANGSSTIYVSLQTMEPSSGSGTVTQSEALYDNLAWYYVTRSPNTYLYQYHQGPSTYYLDAATTVWDSLTWRGCMDYDVGASLGRYSVFSSGTDPTGQSYVVYQREYSNALVLMRARGAWNENITTQTAVTINLPTAHREVLVDGTLGPLSTTFTLRNGRGLILAKTDGGESYITPPTPMNPTNGATVANLQPTLLVSNGYDSESRSLQYQFQLDINGDFAGVDLLESSPVNVYAASGGTTAWDLPQTLTDGSSYYWRCRVVTTSGAVEYSTWSGVYSFTVSIPTSNICPTAPAPLSPANGSEVTVTNPQLVVQNGADSDGDVLTYGFIVATDVGLTNVVASVANYSQGAGSTAWTVNTGLAAGQTYYWSARVYDGQCYSGWSTTRSFSVAVGDGGVNVPPPVPTGVYPTAGESVSAEEIELVANNVIDPNGDQVLYQFLLYEDGIIVDAEDNIIPGPASTTHWRPRVAMSKKKAYTWRVQCHDATTYSGWSPAYPFLIKNSVPPAPDPESPLTEDTLVTSEIVLVVNNVTDPDDEPVTYEFAVFDDEELTSLVTSMTGVVPGIGRTYWPADFTPPHGKRFWWCSRAVDESEPGPWCAAQSFVTIQTVVSVAPHAEFSGAPVSGMVPLPVNFTDLSSDVTSWHWDFGDGVTADNQHPSHLYAAAGTYTVTLTVGGPGGSDYETKTDYITVTCESPTADFSVSKTSGEAPMTVGFTNQSIGATSWLWDFGDGTTSNEQHPSHEYTAAGTYTVSLTATSLCGSVVETKTDLITVNCISPTAAFDASVSNGEVPFAVAFTDQSSNATDWAWDFGDGTTSSEQNPSHEYNAEGVFTVSLTVTNACGSATETKTDLITVICTPPSAGFTASSTSGEAPLTVDFMDQSSGATSWLWDFGDGSTSSEKNPSHEFATAGVYTVSLTAINACGSSIAQKSDLISVICTPPTAVFAASVVSGEAPLTVAFTDQSSGATSWLWDYGDGAISNEQNPSHEFAAAGIYTVTLTTTNACGSTIETKTGLISVSCTPPVAEFTVSVVSGEAPLIVDFLDQSSGATSWLWDFGDGTSSNDRNPSHVYNAPGNYTVTLAVANYCGSVEEEKTDLITVSAPELDAMHVQSVDVYTQVWWVLRRALADVRIVDANGQPVPNASVTGVWSGAVSGTMTATTDDDGYATLRYKWRWGDIFVSFCVTDVSKADWVYDSSANNAECDDNDGPGDVVLTDAGWEDIEEIEATLGRALVQNYPNPFNPSTQISYYMPEAGHVTIDIYNMRGQRVLNLQDDEVEAGIHSVAWNGIDENNREVSSGVYLYRITYNGRESISKKMVMLK